MNLVEVFPWNKNFETGIPQIDEQHKQLVHLINTLAGHLAYQSDVPTLNAVFQQLADYAAYHFQTEEAVWHQYFAEDESEASHKKVHSSFIDEVLKIKGNEDSQPLEQVLEEILTFLTHWLAFHILDEDMRMSKAVLAVQSGKTLEESKLIANDQMSGAMKVLIETILTMYDSLSVRTLQLAREIAERMRMQSKLKLAANVIENTLDAICITDANGVVIDANPSFYESAGLNADEVMGMPLKEIKTGLADELLSLAIWGTAKEGEHWSGELPSRSRSGEIEHEWLTLSSIKDEEGELRNYVAVFSNITHLIKRQHNLERIAHHDALTGLPNRLLLADRIGQAVAFAKRSGDFVAVCFLDLDGFKSVNDRLGHAAGDALLKEIALRLLKVVRGNDTVARIGGDEFVLLLGELKHAQDYRELLDRVLKEVGEPIQIGKEIVSVSVSIGITIFPEDDSDTDTLIRHADKAMYRAKKLGKSRYCQYKEE